MRNRSQTAITGNAEGRCKSRGIANALIIGQTKAHNLSGPVTGILNRQTSKRSRVKRMANSRGRNDQCNFNARALPRSNRLVNDDLQSGSNPANPRRIRRGVDLHLEATRALGRIIFRGLGNDPPHRGFGTDQSTSGIVGALETEPTASICGHG